MHKLNELSLVKMAPDSLSSDEEIKRISFKIKNTRRIKKKIKKAK